MILKRCCFHSLNLGKIPFAHFDADPFLVNLQGVFDDLAHDEYAEEDGKEVESIPISNPKVRRS